MSFEIFKMIRIGVRYNSNNSFFLLRKKKRKSKQVINVSGQDPPKIVEGADNALLCISIHHKEIKLKKVRKSRRASFCIILGHTRAKVRIVL